MKRDAIFYKLFQQSPTLLFDLLGERPANADSYRFDSVAVKEPKFEIDGVFLLPESDSPGVVYFCEVQFQKDGRLYERLFSELFLYFYRNRNRYSNWQAVVIYPARNREQNETAPYQMLLNSNQVHRVYLNELGDIRQLPLGLALMVLTTVEEEQAPAEAKYLLDRAKEDASDARGFIIELVTTIVLNRFTQLSKAEVEVMLDIRLQETRVYQEAKEEGRQEEAIDLVLGQLSVRLGQELSEAVRTQVMSLSLPLLKELSMALLNFEQQADLEQWLQNHQNHESE